jgi:hypothetical protein
MAALCARSRATLSPLHFVSALLVALAIATPAAAAPLPDNAPITVILDQARIMQLPDRAATVVVGNPLIADLSIQPGGLAVVTGKSYGATNFIVMDKTGAVLMEKMVQVQFPNDPIVVVYRGVDRETYSCTPDCSRRLTLGDTPDFFDKTMSQITSRNTQAIGAGALNSGH